MKAKLRAIGAAVKAVVFAVWGVRAEAAAVAALAGGWALLWLGLADVFAPLVSRRGLLAIGAGLFLLSCFGWRLLRTIAAVGVYALTRDGDQ